MGRTAFYDSCFCIPINACLNIVITALQVNSLNNYYCSVFLVLKTCSCVIKMFYISHALSTTIKEDHTSRSLLGGLVFCIVINHVLSAL